MSGKECSTCKKTKSKDKFTNSQYKKPKWQRMCLDCQKDGEVRLGTINQMKSARAWGKKSEDAMADYLEGMAYVSEFVVDTEG